MADDSESPADLLARMMGAEYYLIENRMLTDPAELGPKLAEHLRFMIGLEKEGTLLLSGPLYDRHGTMTGEGVTIIRAKSFDEAEDIARRDPFVVAGLREPRVRRWVANEGRISITVDLSDRSATFG